MLMHAELLTFLNINLCGCCAACSPPPAPWSCQGVRIQFPRCPFSCPVGSRAQAQVALHCSPLQGFTSLPREHFLQGA